MSACAHERDTQRARERQRGCRHIVICNTETLLVKNFIALVKNFIAVNNLIALLIDTDVKSSIDYTVLYYNGFAEDFSWEIAYPNNFSASLCKSSN